MKYLGPNSSDKKKKIENMKMERMQHIALYFPNQHLERVDKCELIEKMMWENYFSEKDPTKRVSILNTIMNMQPYLSGYYDATRYVLEKTVKTQADIMKQPRTYLSIDVRKQREKEVEAERRARALRVHDSSNYSERSKDPPVPAIEEDTEVEIEAPEWIDSKQDVSTPREQPQIQAKCTTSDTLENLNEGPKEGDVIGRPWTPAEAYKTLKKSKAGSNTETTTTSF